MPIKKRLQKKRPPNESRFLKNINSELLNRPGFIAT